ncbi:hypothetical protein TNCV_3072301 [Trichonephila clavipes]|nr:hypothetical protein TNCV_3072301 [Trichonephila clavipes]
MLRLKRPLVGEVWQLEEDGSYASLEHGSKLRDPSPKARHEPYRFSSSRKSDLGRNRTRKLGRTRPAPNQLRHPADIYIYKR